MITLSDIQKAHERIKPYIIETPIVRLPNLDKILGCQVYAKPECLQVTGSFKIRGALNKMLQLNKTELSKGVVAASSGNHGKALCYGAKLLGTRASIVIPTSAPEVKEKAILALGGEVTRADVTKRFEVAEQICKEKGAIFIHPFNDLDVIAGQGTLGLEICSQMPSLTAVITPLSGGGLLGGVATAIKETNPNIKVYGAEPAALPRYTESLKKGEPVTVPTKPTLADALPAIRPGDNCFLQVKKYVDGVFDVSDEYLMKASKALLLEGHLLAEFSSAIGIAAVMQGCIKFKETDKVCFVISGGGVDLPQLDLLKEY